MYAINLLQLSEPYRDSRDAKGIYYRVWTFSDIVHFFESKRAAYQFLTETSRFLTIKMHDVNISFGQLYYEYRRIWPYLYDKKANNDLLTDINKRISDNLQDLPTLLMLIARNTDYQKRHSHYFNSLDTAYHQLIEACTALIEFYKHRNQGADVHQYNVFLANLKRNRLELTSYGRGHKNVWYTG